VPAKTAPHIDAVEAEAGHLFVQGSGEPGANLDIYLNNAPMAGAKVGPDGRWSLTVRHGVTAGNYQVRVDQVGPGGKVVARAAAPFTYAPQTAAASAPSQGPSAAGSGAAPQEGSTSSSAASAGSPGAPSAQESGVATAGQPHAGTAGSEAPVTAAAGAGQGGSAANPVIENIGTVTIVKGDNLWTISRHTYGHGIRYTVIYAANQDQIRDPDLIYPGQVFVLPPAKGPISGAASSAAPG
jgi:nucleoid-associated protein YgaU